MEIEESIGIDVYDNSFCLEDDAFWRGCSCYLCLWMWQMFVHCSWPENVCPCSGCQAFVIQICSFWTKRWRTGSNSSIVQGYRKIVGIYIFATLNPPIFFYRDYDNTSSIRFMVQTPAYTDVWNVISTNAWFDGCGTRPSETYVAVLLIVE